MKRFLSLMMTLVVLLTSFSVPAAAAESWSCPACTTANSGNFCTNCGSAKPEPKVCLGCGYEAAADSTFKFCPACGLEFGKEEATPTPKPTATLTPKPTPSPTPKKTPTPTPARTFRIDGVKVNDNGTLMVNWTDSANLGPYKLCYEQHVSDTYFSEAQNKIQRFIALESTSNKYGKIKYAEPGANYWISLYDRNGDCVRYAYKPSRFLNFTEFTVGMDATLRSQRGSSKSDLKRFSASDIASASNTEWLAYVKLTHSQLRKKRAFSVHFAIRDPKGIILSVPFDSGMTMPRGVSTQAYNLSLNTAFENAKEIYGYIPTGTYSISMYFDGMFVNSLEFRVGQ